MVKKRKPLFDAGQDWSFELLEKTWIEIDRIAKTDLRLDYYKPQLEVISSEQMLDCYAATGLPIMYKHWSFGKEFLRNHKAYSTGQMGLAYEIVINSDPCIAYLMEENNMTMQCLVMAHASAGHSAVFKNNKMFKQFTDAGAIIDYLVFAKNYLAACEEKYGAAEVESVLDSCHALMDYGVDRYTRRGKLSASEEQKRALDRLEQERIDYDPIWDKVVPKKDEIESKDQKWPKDREDNILYFIEKYAPSLPSWKREVIRIIRKISQYFYPQSQTKVLNEGYATFTHYYIMEKMRAEGLITEGSYMEFIKSHTGVVFQPDFDSKYFSGLNPYALGFAIFMDIKRICEHPTEEDRRWFPNLVDTDWVAAQHDAMMNYKDDSFIQQFLSPKVIRDFRLFTVRDDDDNDFVEIASIHNDQGYIKVRNSLADSYNRANWVPDIQVDEVDVNGDRTLYLVHTPFLGRTLHEGLAKETIAHVANLWEFDVVVETQTDAGNLEIEYLAHGTKKDRKR